MLICGFERLLEAGPRGLEVDWRVYRKQDPPEAPLPPRFETTVTFDTRHRPRIDSDRAFGIDPGLLPDSTE